MKENNEVVKGDNIALRVNKSPCDVCDGLFGYSCGMDYIVVEMVST